MSGLFEVLASEDHEGRIAKRKATAIAKKRVTERFANFIAQAKDSNERKNRIDLVREDLVDLVTATCREYDVEPETITTAILAHLAAEPKGDDDCGCGGDCKCKKDDESKTASVHEARKPKVCPYHREVMDISLAQGEARAGFDAMAQHAWGPQHCKGNEYEGGNCNFKPEMTTQQFWDERAEKAQERREQREQALQEQQQQEAEAVQEQPEEDNPAATLEDGFEGEQVDTAPDNVVEVDFGATDGTSAVGEGVEAQPEQVAASVADRRPLAERTAEQKEHLKGVDSDKRQRQYEHIKEQCLSDGKGEDECKELAARTVNKQRAEKGETKGSKTAEALETVDVTKGGEDPIPKIDKRKWTPENLKQRLDTEGEGSPKPTRQKDILERIDYENQDFLEEADAVTEKQDVSKDTGPEPATGGWGSGSQADPVTSAVEDEFLSPDEIRAAIARVR